MRVRTRDSILMACVLCAGVFPVGSAGTASSGSRTSGVAAEARAELLASIRQTLARSRELMEIYEREHLRLAVEVGKRRSFYERGLIARRDVEDADEALRELDRKIAELARSIRENENALAEAALAGRAQEVPAANNGAVAIRFDGTGRWSLADAREIEDFFSRAFGRPLPVSARGQTPTHDRLRFDHRDALDVALHPDSPEGRSLIAYLRRSGIPFVAFRNAAAGAATGAHIHIGRPSLRVSEAVSPRRS
ncbi:MAG TPA: hypothetical protein VNN77_03525 [candidate division Zixibacteria bacterium]|nr:hypothetical protein [candidate division Zixibacteria bacterium]